MTVKLDTAVLDRIISSAPAGFADVVSKTAFRILADARITAPRDPKRPPKFPEAYDPTGALRGNSDVVKVDPVGLTQNVEFYQEYALAQELGREEINLPPRPYLTPSVEKNAAQFERDLAKVIE